MKEKKENNKNAGRWMFKITPANIALILLGTGINVGGMKLASFLGLPIWLDSVGTFLSSVLLGPVEGAISGALMNVVAQIFEPGQIWFCLVSITGGLTVGKFFPRDRKIDSFSVIATALFAGLVMTVVSTPLNMYFNQGFTGNEWGDALVKMLGNYINLKVICCVAGELLVNMPDKAVSIWITLLIVYIIRKLRNTDGNDRINNTDNSEENEKSGNVRESKTDAESPVKIAVDHDTAKTDIISGTSLKIITCLIITGAVLSTAAFGQKKTMAADLGSEYIPVMYGVDDGLISAEINAIAQTSDGYIWAGAYSGLYRYDGSGFEKINIDDRINNVTCLFEDSSSRLWIGTNDCGAACLDEESLEPLFYTVKEGLAADSVRSLCEDDAGNVYIGTTDSLCRVDKNGKVTSYAGYDDIECVYSLNNAGDGCISGVTADGIFFIMDDGSVVCSLKSDKDEYSFTSAACGENGEILVGTSSDKMVSLQSDKKGGLKVLDETGVEGLSYINCIRYSKAQRGYFVTASTGLAYVDPDHNATVLSQEDFSNSVSDVCEDYQGNIWFSSSSQGIMKLSPDPFTNVFKKSGIKEAVVNALLYDDGLLYACTDTGLIIDDENSNTSVENDLTERLAGVRIRHILKDSKENLWISTYGQDGLLCVDKSGKVRTYCGRGDGVVGSMFRFTLELSDGSILAVSTEGLNFIKEGVVEHSMGKEDGLETQILSAVQTGDGDILAGSDGGGIYRIRDGVITQHKGSEDGLQSLVILKIIPYKNSFFYVTSNGLYFDDDNGIRKLQNFPYSNNYDIYITRQDKAWVSSSAGIYVVNASKLAGDEEYGYILLNRDRGLDTTLMANAWDAGLGYELFLCCTDGVRRINTKTFNDLSEDYSIILASVVENEQVIREENGRYMLPAGNGQIKIKPAILNYAASNPLISAKLEGSTIPEVRMLQSELTELNFTGLPYGEYRLKICVIDELGGGVKREESFLFHKDSELYERPYYKAYLIFVMVLFAGFLAWMVAKMSNMAIINRQYDQIREAKEEAERANNAKSLFLANMSHEIRTPINAVLGMDEMILRESSESQIRSYASDIYTAGNTLLSLINDILDSSKIESGKMEIVPVEYEITTLIRDLINMISQRARQKDLELITQIDPALPKGLFGDDVRIRQIVTNILTNAVKYTPAGQVYLRVRLVSAGDENESAAVDDPQENTPVKTKKKKADTDGIGKNRIAAGQDKENTDKCVIRFEVEDTGVGIKKEDIPKLFEAYQRIDEDKNRHIEGTGLGMNITTRLLTMMDSTLQVESEYGKGSRFWFDLTQKVTDDTAIGDFEEHLRAGGNEYSYEGGFIAPDARVLVVDDNAMNRKVFKSLLKVTQIRIDEAGGGMEALELAGNTRYDIVFMDHMMPDMDGIETMHRMRKMKGYEDAPIFVLTANAVTGAREQYLAEGFSGFISKPIVSEKLEQAIAQTLPDDMKKPYEGGSTAAKSAPDTDDLPAVDGLDWDYALLHLPDKEALLQAVEEFYNVLKVQGDKLQKMYEELVISGDKTQKDKALEAYRIQVHGMKSGAATIGIVPLAGMAKILEFAVRDNDEKIIKDMHDTFISEWYSYKDKLKPLAGTDESAEEEKPAADMEMLSAMFEMLKNALEDFDVDAADDIMAKIRSYSYPPKVRESIDALSAAVADLDQDEAERLMEGITQL